MKQHIIVCMYIGDEEKGSPSKQLQTDLLKMQSDGAKIVSFTLIPILILLQATDTQISFTSSRCTVQCAEAVIAYEKPE